MLIADDNQSAQRIFGKALRDPNFGNALRDPIDVTPPPCYNSASWKKNKRPGVPNPAAQTHHPDQGSVAGNCHILARLGSLRQLP